MPTPVRLAPTGPSTPEPGARRFNFNRPLAVGAALALWAVIFVALRLLAA